MHKYPYDIPRPIMIPLEWNSVERLEGLDGPHPILRTINIHRLADDI
jgi:hypothetical protein